MVKSHRKHRDVATKMAMCFEAYTEVSFVPAWQSLLSMPGRFSGESGHPQARTGHDWSQSSVADKPLLVDD